MRRYLHEIISLLGEDKKRLPRLLLLFLMVSMLDLAGIGLIGPYIAMVADPQLAGSVFDKVEKLIEIPKEPRDLIIITSFILLGVFLMKTVSAIWINYIIIRFSIDQQIRIRSHLMQTYQALPYTEYMRRNSSEYIHNTQTLVGQYSGGVVSSGMRTLSDGIVAIVILSLLAWTNLEAFLLLFGLLSLVLFGYDKIFRGNIRVYGEKANNAANKMVQGIHEGISGLKEIRILGHEEYFYNQVRENAKKYGVYHARSQLVATAPRYLLELVMVLFIVSLVLMTLVIEQNSQQLLPTLGVFGLAAIRLLPAANVFSSSLTLLRFNRDSVSRLYNDVINIQSKIISTGACSKKEHNPFKVLSIDQISFRYPRAKEDALNKLTLKINAGDSIGFVGASGSGKTTLIDVLLGLIEPQSGEIRYNNQPLSRYLNSWQSHVAYLPQEVFLIDDTLAKNVALGVEDGEIDQHKLHDALRVACLNELVEQLPDGIETTLGEGGVRISGGQRQRVAMARAFYNERDVLVLDESTSALDTKTEREIVDEIGRLKGDRTMIVIAHRLTTLQYCDQIYRLDNGKIVEKGSYAQILENGL
jgi:ATP-binding cassette, subfamily B, bacterial PglK